MCKKDSTYLYMKTIKLFMLLACLASSKEIFAAMWEVGRLDYPSGSSEIAAFVDLPNGVQVQNILCTKRESSTNRLAVLLPKAYNDSSIIELKVESDANTTSAYAELSGNSLSLHVDNNVITSLIHAPDFALRLNKEDAKLLDLPEVLDIPMQGSSFANLRVASECTVQCLNNDFNCNKSLVSSLLWPVRGFEYQGSNDIDTLCTVDNHGYKEFNLTNECKLVLDRFYQKNGRGPISFIEDIFSNNPDYLNYQSKWNSLVDRVKEDHKVDDGAYALDKDWYLVLYSLLSTQKLVDYPKSYFEVLKYQDDPTTLLYDIDSRYEMESLKYTAVLTRRIQGVLSDQQLLSEALTSWNDFYREFSYTLPAVFKAQALRPLIYREMLLRLWLLADKPQGIELKDSNIFVQGSQGKTTTEDELEKKCTVFDGVNREQFFFYSDTCERMILQNLRDNSKLIDSYKTLNDSFNNYLSAWQKSVFFKEADNSIEIEDQLRSNYALVLMSIAKIYGFGDYFLMRECISTQDDDICVFEKNRAMDSYIQELNNKIKAINSVNSKDARQLSKLHDNFLEYNDMLQLYLNELVVQNKLKPWQATFALAMNIIMQTNTIISMPYHNEIVDDGLDLILESED